MGLDCIDRLKTAKINLEALAQETEDTLKEKLNTAKQTMAAKKQEAESAMVPFDKILMGSCLLPVDTVTYIACYLFRRLFTIKNPLNCEKEATSNSLKSPYVSQTVLMNF